ncbi:hypothetical protein N7499_003672 [Penicillium canescens]|uniref:Uncharacterized protein n=1 Tax=Penicillium canescens TaxID=5083 RepID=A0AAD6N7W8_PENCN|nr:uncharacterized protein N7446_012620 [Penicillium canescens]KAJ6038809.1 hypothetical protein N7460_007526 [Penicillium canescens]KAJ6045756.1 hypothetical protein N7446_012620 [Penicillium canescens]KAJ6066343.1 hypothetical protein N7444_000096 [Penicillium canescens]KAJ6090958.1 hypothetical protein N7499_003672 [Penicillium canescens]KAJ6175180.1 hypothetical protein N7485_004985 [Penicillium canescens]
MSSPFLDLQSNPISKEKVLGSGNSALVVLQNSVAVKIPLRCLWSSDSDIEGNIQNVYYRLQGLKDKHSVGLSVVLGFPVKPRNLPTRLMAIFEIALSSADLPTSFNSHVSMTWLARSAISMTDVYLSRTPFCDFSAASLFP